MRPVTAVERAPAKPPAARRCGCSDLARCELRCGCGSLLARRVAEGVELKCRRCKRTLVLSLAEG